MKFATGARRRFVPSSRLPRRLLTLLPQKCDAKRPFCNTCKVAGKELECEYDDEIRQSVTAALLLRTQELEQRLAMYESSQRLPTSPPGSMSVQGLTADLDIPMHLFDLPGPSDPMPGEFSSSSAT